MERMRPGVIRKMLLFTHGRSGTSCGSKMENQREISAKSFHEGILTGRNPGGRVANRGQVTGNRLQKSGDRAK